MIDLAGSERASQTEVSFKLEWTKKNRFMFSQRIIFLWLRLCYKNTVYIGIDIYEKIKWD